ncbi:MAG: LptF/LptG family permease [Kiritimatiellae bacterium]|nr:LptF/LptG family permease [Kiritimatiellia bacterium]
MSGVRILRSYVGQGFLTTFVATFVVVTFVSSLWFIFKLTDVLARGVNWRPVVRIFVYSLPTSMVFAIPLAALIACLLVFGRLSADSEITAMRAAGINLWQILAGPLLYTALLTAVSLYVVHELEPRAHFLRRTLDASLKGISPLDVLRENRFVRDIEGVTLFVGRKRGALCEDIRIYDARDPALVREIHAKRGRASTDAGGTDLVLELFEVRVEPTSHEIKHPSFLGRYTLSLKNLGQTGVYVKDHEDMPLSELLPTYLEAEQLYSGLSPTDLAYEKHVLRYELSRRTALGFSALALVLAGIPLGIKSHRKESTIGIALALGVFVMFYSFVLVAESLMRIPRAHAEILIWIPVVSASGFGIFLARRVMN